MTPSNICRHGVNFPRLFLQISSMKEVPQSTAHKYHIAPQRQSGVIFSDGMPINPSNVPKMKAFTATKVENYENKMLSSLNTRFIPTKMYVKPKSNPVAAA